jgi:hypothetical protein
MTEPSGGKQGGIGVLGVIGLAWAALSGLCTATFVVPAMRDPYGASLLAVALLLGVPSIGVGLIFVFADYMIRRSR